MGSSFLARPGGELNLSAGAHAVDLLRAARRDGRLTPSWTLGCSFWLALPPSCYGQLRYAIRGHICLLSYGSHLHSAPGSSTERRRGHERTEMEAAAFIFITHLNRESQLRPPRRSFFQKKKV